MSFLLIIYDEHEKRVRSFHDPVFHEADRRAIQSVLDRHLELVRARDKRLVSHPGGHLGVVETPTTIYDKDHPHMKPFEEKAGIPSSSAALMTQGELARAAGFTGEVCENPNCGSFNVVRTGTCATCQDCGWNKGCS